MYKAFQSFYPFTHLPMNCHCIDSWNLDSIALPMSLKNVNIEILFDITARR